MAPTVTITQPVTGTTVPPAQVTVQATATDDTGPVGRALLDVRDDATNVWTQAPGRTITGPGPYQWTFDASGWQDASKHTFRVTAFPASGSSKTAFATVTVKALPPPPTAEITITPGEFTRTTFTAAPAATYAWEIDGVPAGSTASIDRLFAELGVHHVKLTITDDYGQGSTIERDFEVVWRGVPYAAQLDGNLAVNPAATPWQSPFIRPDAPWRRLDALNPADVGHPTFTQNPDGTASFEVHQGDHPTAGGGDRVSISSGVSFRKSYDWRALGLPGPVDFDGNGSDDAGVWTPRFWRVEFMLPVENPPTMEGVNNFFEFRGGNYTTLKPETNAPGTVIRWSFAPKLNGVAAPRILIDEHPYVPGEWQNYVVEMVMSADSARGYVRIFRDGRCVTLGLSQADAEGRLFGATRKSDTNGLVADTGWGFQMYRHPTLVATTFMQVRNTMIGLSYDAVMQ